MTTCKSIESHASRWEKCWLPGVCWFLRHAWPFSVRHVLGTGRWAKLNIWLWGNAYFWSEIEAERRYRKEGRLR